MTVDNSFGIPLNNNFGPYWNSLFGERDFQNHMDEMFRLGYQNGLKSKLLNSVPPNTPGTANSILNDQQAEYNFVKSTNTNKNEDNIQIEDEQLNSNSWFSEFEEMKNAENQKVNIL